MAGSASTLISAVSCFKNFPGSCLFFVREDQPCQPFCGFDGRRLFVLAPDPKNKKPLPPLQRQKSIKFHLVFPILFLDNLSR
jgi:hypothetical protein